MFWPTPWRKCNLVSSAHQNRPRYFLIHSADIVNQVTRRHLDPPIVFEREPVRVPQLWWLTGFSDVIIPLFIVMIAFSFEPTVCTRTSVFLRSRTDCGNLFRYVGATAFNFKW